MIKILSDSTCDLSKELILRYGIGIIPLHILLGDEEYRDGADLTPEDIYRWSDEHKATPKTSAVSEEDAEAIMRPLLAEGHELIIFCISESMSTTGNMLRLTAKALDAEDRVHVVNSENLSTGIGLLVIRAAEMAAEGKSAEEILAEIAALTPKVRASFVVDSLTYLHRGGRCSGLAALAGGMLRLHPRIYVENGAMGVGKKYRGRIESVILHYAKDMEEDLKNAIPDRVFVTHSGMSQEVLQPVIDYVASLGHFKEILVTQAGGVISSHCGPGTLGVLFISK